MLRLKDYPKARELLEYLHTNVANSAPQYQMGGYRNNSNNNNNNNNINNMEEEGERERENCDVMALLVEHAISGLPHCNAVEDKESAQQPIFFGILFNIN